MSLRALTYLALIILLLTGRQGAAQEAEIAELEKAFAEADLRIINTLSDVPDDVIAALCPKDKCNFSDFGEWWNTTDVIYGDEPRAQHLYTGISDAIAAVVYQTGGLAGPGQTLLLMNRHSHWSCRYGIPRRFGIVDNMSWIKQLFPLTKGSPLKCHLRQIKDQ
jgi:hypothetical protein